ncbi:putative holin-like toxin [Clostridium cochlearium]|uniref:Putative holin-like toxin n=1 Tax=Clostridium cochlearium TaxID=1494 RepID=A0A7Y3XXH7_CLOCO|nr:putative holin-like toxin [Clostridium cochlearium]MBE6161892.1 putative holin-like toxin [Bacillota bacterium]NOH15396.1 putative holin-like toxin [Clostridium cochlearium]
MSIDILMLLFQGGLFLITLLTLIVILIEKNSKK